MKTYQHNLIDKYRAQCEYSFRCICILVISILCWQEVFSQQVKIVSPSKYGVWNLTDIEKSGDKEFMCGDGGLFLSGNLNKGIDFHERVALPDIGSAMLIDLDFNSTSNGILIASGGIILTSTDNAITWTKSLQDSTDFLTSVEFLSETHALITAMNGTLYKSINSGINWQKIKLPVNIDLRSSATKNKTTLVSGDIGFIARSTDLGATWTMSSKSYLGALYSIASTDNAFIVGGSNGIYYSDDDGLTWKRANQPTGMRVKLIKTLGRDAFAVTDSGYIYRSGDDGKNWSKTLTPNQYSINGMLILSNTTWLNVGENSNAKHTSNNGGYYQDYMPPTDKNFVSVVAIDPITYIVVSTSGKVVKTTTSNEIMPISQLPIGFYRKSVAVGKLIYVLEEKGIVYVSSDAGVTWKEYAKITENVVCNDFSVSGDYLFVATTKGEVYKYDKNQWAAVKVKDSLNLTAIRFVDNDNGFVCGSLGKMYFTANSGSSWQESSTPSYAMITDAYMTTANNAFACGFDGEIYKTSNKGVVWTKLPMASLNENIVTVAMHDNMLWGAAATSNGNMVYTDDGFKTWKTIYNFGGLITDIIIQGTEFVAVGQYSLIMRGTFLPVSVDESNLEPTIRIYPNPSSGAFTLYIPNNEQDEVSLSIYDNLGKKVHTLLLNEPIPMGEYKFNFDASRLPTGVYRLNVKQRNTDIHLPIMIIR